MTCVKRHPNTGTTVFIYPINVITKWKLNSFKRNEWERNSHISYLFLNAYRAGFRNCSCYSRKNQKQMVNKRNNMIRQMHKNTTHTFLFKEGNKKKYSTLMLPYKIFLRNLWTISALWDKISNQWPFSRPIRMTAVTWDRWSHFCFVVPQTL